MIRLLASVKFSTMRCQGLNGKAIAILLSACERVFAFAGLSFAALGIVEGDRLSNGSLSIKHLVQASDAQGIEVIQQWLNPECSNQSGRCRYILLPT